MRIPPIFPVLAGAAFLTACGSTAVPAAKVAQAQSAVSAAEAVGASDNPRAALHLKLANDQIQQAERLSSDDEAEEAALVLERAESDAELARLIVEREREQREAIEARERVKELE